NALRRRQAGRGMFDPGSRRRWPLSHPGLCGLFAPSSWRAPVTEEEPYKGYKIILQEFWYKTILSAVSHQQLPTILVLSGCRKEVPMLSIHVCRSARDYFVDGIYWGDDEEGVMLYLRAKGVPPDKIRKALEQIAQEGTSMIQYE